MPEQETTGDMQFTVCHLCGSAWTTGESIYWQQESCGFCGSDDLSYNVPIGEVQDE